MSTISTAPAYTSLLWPDRLPTTLEHHWQPNSIADLGLEPVIAALNVDGKHEAVLKTILLSLSADSTTIDYRQEIVEDLLRVPALLSQLEGMLPLFSDLTYYGSMSELQGLPFQKTLARLGELELYVQAVITLDGYLREAGPNLHSRGLTALRDLVRTRIADPDFDNLKQELPKITQKIRNLRSITLGINLDHNLRPIGATIVSLNAETFKGAGLFRRILGERAEYQGIAQLHSVPMKQVATMDGRLVPTPERADPMLFPLFKDLDGIIADTVRPMEAALKHFIRISTQFLAILEPEIVFYVGAIRLIRNMEQRGLPMCRPRIAPMEARACVIRDNYNLNLALRTMYRQPEARLAESVVSNDARFDDTGRIFIITGPNQGGKTTYIQAIAIAQVLFQAGMYVPGSSATISPVDGIYTHFPVEEKPNAESGRFGEEAQRLNEVFRLATRHSLVLLNESLSSTAAGESLFLARDIVRCLRLLGVRAAYTTHLHELAASVDMINADTQGDSVVVSLVAMAQPTATSTEPGSVKRTYKFVVSPPMGHSYAQELAARYGISFDRIVEILVARQVIGAQKAR